MYILGFLFLFLMGGSDLGANCINIEGEAPDLLKSIKICSPVGNLTVLLRHLKIVELYCEVRQDVLATATDNDFHVNSKKLETIVDLISKEMVNNASNFYKHCYRNQLKNFAASLRDYYTKFVEPQCIEETNKTLAHIKTNLLTMKSLLNTTFSVGPMTKYKKLQREITNNFQQLFHDDSNLPEIEALEKNLELQTHGQTLVLKNYTEAIENGSPKIPDLNIERGKEDHQTLDKRNNNTRGSRIPESLLSKFRYSFVRF